MLKLDAMFIANNSKKQPRKLGKLMWPKQPQKTKGVFENAQKKNVCEN